MPEDIAIDENFVSEFDEVGDIATHRDTEATKQSVAISVIEFTPDTPVGFTSTAIEERRGNIERAVRDNPFTSEPISVIVANKNQTTQTITYRVRTQEVTFPIDIDA